METLRGPQSLYKASNISLPPVKGFSGFEQNGVAMGWPALRANRAASLQPHTQGEDMADIDQLAATFKQIVAAISKRDANAYSSFWHDQIVIFPPFSSFAGDGKATLRQLAEANFSNAETWTVFARWTFTFAKVAGKRQEVAIHASYLPSGT